MIDTVLRPGYVVCDCSAEVFIFDLVVDGRYMPLAILYHDGEGEGIHGLYTRAMSEDAATEEVDLHASDIAMACHNAVAHSGIEPAD